jgi:hypothetical protein
VDEALHDPANCFGYSGYVECDEWTIISAGDMNAWQLDFRDGGFVAQLYWVGGRWDCFTGPAQFPLPSCPGETSMKLPVCP